MSGFEFYVSCGSCDLRSPLYPFRYESWLPPRTLCLPLAIPEEGSFDTLRIANVDDRLTTAQLLELAQAHSTDAMVACVPVMRASSVELIPTPSCPKCGQGPLTCHFGSLPVATTEYASLVDVVAHSRTMSLGETHEYSLPGARVTIECSHDGSTDAPLLHWSIQQAEDASSEHVPAAVEELRSLLHDLGRRCTPTYRGRRYAQFDES